MARTVRKEKAAKRAEELLAVTGNLELPVDPKKLADSEAPVLVLIGDDFRNRFDGQLEYHAAKNRFLLFYNTKYDAALPAGTHHPRTRFSIGHELGHWSTASSGLIEAELYPPARGDKGSPTAIAQWAEFESGHARKAKRSAFASQWFRSYEREHLRHIHVEEQYLPVPTMETLVVLLSVPEDELEREDEGEE